MNLNDPIIHYEGRSASGESPIYGHDWPCRANWSVWHPPVYFVDAAAESRLATKGFLSSYLVIVHTAYRSRAMSGPCAASNVRQATARTKMTWVWETNAMSCNITPLGKTLQPSHTINLPGTWTGNIFRRQEEPSSHYPADLQYYDCLSTLLQYSVLLLTLYSVGVDPI